MDERYRRRSYPYREQVAAARQLLRTARNVSLSTTRSMGYPEAVVIANGFVFHQREFGFVWWSFADSAHSADVRRTTAATVLVYDSHNDGISLNVPLYARELDFNDVPGVLPLLNHCRRRLGIGADRLVAEFEPSQPKRLYWGSPSGDITVPLSRFNGPNQTGIDRVTLPEAAFVGFEREID